MIQMLSYFKNKNSCVSPACVPELDRCLLDYTSVCAQAIWSFSPGKPLDAVKLVDNGLHIQL